MFILKHPNPIFPALNIHGSLFRKHFHTTSACLRDLTVKRPLPKPIDPTKIQPLEFKGIKYRRQVIDYNETAGGKKLRRKQQNPNVVEAVLTEKSPLVQKLITPELKVVLHLYLLSL